MPYQYNKCKCDDENIISQLLKVQAQVTVTPLVEYGTPKVCCIDSSIKPNSCYDCECCDYHSYDYNCECNPCSCNSCNFTLTQVICIEIPISIDADVNIKEGIECCNKQEIEPIDNITKNKPFYMPMI